MSGEIAILYSDVIALREENARFKAEAVPDLTGTDWEPTSHYRHNRTDEDNGDAHLKRQVTGREVVVAVTGGRLDFGPWE